MLDRIAPELVDHILRLAVHAPQGKIARHRNQYWLAQLCRTSKLLRDHAEPLLYRDILIERFMPRWNLMKTLDARPELCETVRTLRLHHDVDRPRGSIMLLAGIHLFSRLPCLRELVLHGLVDDPLDLTCLSVLTELQTLTLAVLRVKEPRPGLVFPSVRSLTVIDLMHEHASTFHPRFAREFDYNHLLSPSVFPALHALAVNFGPSRKSNALVERLELFQVHTNAFITPNLQPLAHIPHVNVVVVTLDRSLVFRLDLKHLPRCHWRLIPPSYILQDRQTLVDCLDVLQLFLASTRAPPLSLHLPRGIVPMCSRTTEGGQYRVAFLGFVGAAAGKKVELRWHSDTTDGGGNLTISRSYWAFLEEQSSISSL